MPDFTARFTEGITVIDWEDPAAGSKPSRINPAAGHPHLRIQGVFNTPVRWAATVGGVEAPADGALGGRLFTSWFVEYPRAQPMIMAVGGKSSHQEFTPLRVGHYVIGMRRPGGGAVLMHLDVMGN